ncbi:MAG: ATP-binding cassette domain-containing protein [Pseudomonadota bacterium]|nr:ATP-binding cassette domain-containing protein [Pseudomonadota bacterium]
MALLALKEVSLKYGEQVILDKVNFELKKNERICLLGRNGTGKSTFFRIVMSIIQPDFGQVIKLDGLKMELLQQELPRRPNLNVKSYLKTGLSDHVELIKKYNYLSKKKHTKEVIKLLEQLQTRIETGSGWNVDNRIERIATELNLPLNATIDKLSGGWKRRVSFARSIINEPDILLLDEPTNHLDIETIEWLEKKLLGFKGSLIFTTHDRYFLKGISTKIVELNRGKLNEWNGSFQDFLIKKKSSETNEQRQIKKLTKKLNKEEAWVKQGVKARGTKNEGRKKALNKLREDYSNRVTPNQKIKITIQTEELSSRKLIELYNCSFSYDKTSNIIKKLSLVITKGQRIGLLGNNGVGKSTLLDLITGRLQPQNGTIKISDGASIGYFNQKDELFDLEKNIANYVGDGMDYISINGKERHVVGYLKGFLFSAKRALTPIRYLSGGERNRARLAKLFTKPASILILDEPTNDLDVETMEALEEQILSFGGTLIISSHDRYFLDRVATNILVFETGDKISSYAGGYAQWLESKKSLKIIEKIETTKNKNKASNFNRKTKKKLSYKLKRELQMMPAKISELENKLKQMQERVNEAEFYKLPYHESRPVLKSVLDLESQIEDLMERWEALEIQGNNE